MQILQNTLPGFALVISRTGSILGVCVCACGGVGGGGCCLEQSAANESERTCQAEGNRDISHVYTHMPG